MALVAWEKVCFPKKYGGLNIKSSREWNIAPVGKLLWQLASKQDILGSNGYMGSTMLFRCLGENVVMRPPPLGEEEVPKTTKDKKRRKASPPDTPRPKKSRALKSKTDFAVLPADVVQTLRDEDEEGEDTDCLLVAPKRASIKASKAAEPATTLHREASSKYQAEMARCEADLKKLTEERNVLKLLYVQQKAELVEQLRAEAKMKEVETLGWKQSMDRLASEKDVVRAQLSSVERQLESVKVKNLARAQKVEKLETRLAVELARSTSEVEALVASYLADTEAANTRAKEISDAAEVRLSRVAEHTRRQSQRETLEEVHARGFNLTTDIESAKVLEDEAGALLFDDEDSASGSESGGDED
ncbi:uncharacterized protein [Nicotiana tomentosiformis]|uniref:uncharacterized protein n=1 Tax=Nicotiana tomentosiformis TaxID=4098 RepID=UPI00388C4FE4